jgi:CubicO group peptidase (beta-lactamase class C family)
MRYEPQANPFRTTFVYNNNMYMAAGELIPVLTGMTWDEFVTRRIIEPLGMSRTVTSTVPLAGMENVAQPHLGTGDDLQVVPYRRIDNIGPAGSINSSVSDMTRWLRLHLDRGTFDDRRILDEEIVDAMHTPHMAIPLAGRWAEMMQPSTLLAYGLGWFLHDYRGRKVVQHGGNIDGMHAMVGMIPEERLGVVVLTNRNPNYLSDAIMFRVFDAYLGLPETDWSQRYGGGVSDEVADGEREEPVRVTGTDPSLPLEDYVGTYRHQAYGDFDVTLESGGLVLRFSRDRIGDLTHWHFDTFRIDWRYPTAGDSFVTFELDARARVDEADLQGYGELTRVRN